MALWDALTPWVPRAPIRHHPTRSAERDQHAQRQALLLEFSKQQSCDSVDGNFASGKKPSKTEKKKTRGLRGDCLELLGYPRLKLKNMKDKSPFRKL